MEINNSSQTPSSSAAANRAADFHPLNSSNIFIDLKVLLTKPRYFFEFFVRRDRIDRVVWAKVLLIFLGLAALNSMVSYSSSDPTAWQADFSGLDPRLQHMAQEIFVRFAAVFQQAFSAILPFFTLISTALSAAFYIFILRLLGADISRLNWSGVFCALIAAQWTMIFGCLPGIGSTLIALMPIIYTVVGMSQMSRLSPLRTFFGIILVPAILLVIFAIAIIAFFAVLGSTLLAV